MTALLILALAAEIRVEYRLVECPAAAVKADLGRHDLMKLWREARELAALEVSAGEGEVFSVSRRSRRRFLAGYSTEDRRARPLFGEVGEGVMVWGRVRAGEKGVLLDTFVVLEHGAELREFKTRWGMVELPSLLVGGAGASCLLPPEKTAMVCAWQAPGSEGKVCALLARGHVSSARNKLPLRRAQGEAWFDFPVPPFAEGDIEVPSPRGRELKLSAAEKPVKERPAFVRLRLIRLKASLFDGAGKRPGEKELETWLRRKEARVVGCAALSSFSGQRVCAFWARRKAYFAGFERERTLVRWVASGAAAGVRVALGPAPRPVPRPRIQGRGKAPTRAAAGGNPASVEARTWVSGFDEPFRMMKSRLGRVELPRYDFSSTECASELKPGEERVVCVIPKEEGDVLLLTAGVELPK